uniref:IF rod domain-containing protein n=1 Tax=Ursus americanus TaxID=9643 RepID=A0A452RMG1_URSAM
MNKVNLEAKADDLTHEINFFKTFYETELPELRSQISDVSVVLSMDNSHCLDLDGIIAEVKDQKRWPTAAELRLRPGTRPTRGRPLEYPTEIAEMNGAIQRLQAEINSIKNQCDKLDAAIVGRLRVAEM